MQDIADI